MQDLSRAAATALWSGMSVSSPADAAAADLHRTSGPCVSTRARKHRIPIRRSPAGQCRYLRRIRAERRAAAEGDAREGNGAPRARPVRGAERAADLTAAAAAAARARDAISSPTPVFVRSSRRIVLGVQFIWFVCSVSNKIISGKAARVFWV